MTRHAFGFGATFHPAVLERPEFEPYRERYQAAFLRLFNRAVLANEMKWRYWDRPGTKERTRELLDLLSAHGIEVRGHCMVWPGAAKVPKSVVPLLDGEHNESLRRATLDHIREIGAFYRGKVRDWDVQNEPHQHRAIQRLLGPLCQVEWFNSAREADPGARLVLNENETLLGGAAAETVLATARYLREHDAPLGALGEQAHFDSLPDVQVLWAGFERLASLGLPVIVTEFDAPGVDEDAQADFTRDFYTLAFSHPAVTDVLTWSVWERTALQPSKALLRADFSPKKNLEAYEDLVFRRWWTAADLVTGPDGRCALRGFKGDYELTVESRGRRVARSIHLGEGGGRETVVLR
jgi:GH35 family endo-1,4-beta-xylanase